MAKKRSMQNSTVLTATFKHLFQREPGQDTKGNMRHKVTMPYEKESKYLVFTLSSLYGRL